ncbi:MAG: hypothetical protein MJB12_08425 [Firmicutes bacterium]|nr:hypothetical protein [Bacillota bacterium]
MTNNEAKRVVILRNIKSNFIEEAILILKNNENYRKGAKKSAHIVPDLKKSDCIIKEAQTIIDQYIKQHYAAYNYIDHMPSAKAQKTNQSKKWRGSLGTTLNVALFISVALFIFLLSRAI